MRKFRIKKVSHNLEYPWMLQVNRWDFDHFKTWKDAMAYLIKHWYCECLNNPTNIEGHTFPS